MENEDPTLFPEENPDSFDDYDWGKSDEQDSPDGTQIADDVDYLPPPKRE